MEVPNLSDENDESDDDENKYEQQNEDKAVSVDENENEAVDEPNDESPGLSTFVLVDGSVYHTYSTYARGLEPFNATYGLLDMTAKGRDESELP